MSALRLPLGVFEFASVYGAVTPGLIGWFAKGSSYQARFFHVKMVECLMKL